MSDPASEPPEQIPTAYGPAVHAALRAGNRRTDRRKRPYVVPSDGAQPTTEQVLLAATRALISAPSRERVAAIVRTVVNDLGAGVVPARLAEVSGEAGHVDVSLGVGEPLFVLVDPVSLPAMTLNAVLPQLLLDAHAAAARCDSSERHLRKSSTDALTGLTTRSGLSARLAACVPGDVVCVLDLDGLKRVNDTHGHATGDTALREFARLLQSSWRSEDLCCRRGDDDFVVVCQQLELARVAERTKDLLSRWGRESGGLTASAGVAAVTELGATSALRAADEALYDAKLSGRSCVSISEPRRRGAESG